MNDREFLRGGVIDRARRRGWKLRYYDGLPAVASRGPNHVSPHTVGATTEEASARGEKNAPRGRRSCSGGPREYPVPDWCPPCGGERGGSFDRAAFDALARREGRRCSRSSSPTISSGHRPARVDRGMRRHHFPPPCLAASREATYADAREYGAHQLVTLSVAALPWITVSAMSCCTEGPSPRTLFQSDPAAMRGLVLARTAACPAGRDRDPRDDGTGATDWSGAARSARRRRAVRATSRPRLARINALGFTQGGIWRHHQRLNDS